VKTWQKLLAAFSHWPHPVSADQAADKAGIAGGRLATRLATLCVKNGGLVEGPPGAYRLSEAGSRYLTEMDPVDAPVNIAGVLGDPAPHDIVQQALRVSPISVFTLGQQTHHQPA